MNNFVNLAGILFIIAVVFAMIKLQIFLSKKEKRLFGLIIPVAIFAISLLMAFGGTPTNAEVETIQTVVTENNEIVEGSEDIKTSSYIIDEAFTASSMIVMIVVINIGTIVMLGIYCHYRNLRKTHVELRRMKAKEL